MNRIKLMLLVTVAAIATTAFAAQVASAAHWTNEESALQEPAEVQLSGSLSWNMSGGSINCQVNGAATLSPGNSGQITSFAFSNCAGSGGLAACNAAGPASVPWQIEAGDKKITGSAGWEWTLTSKSGQLCNLKKLSFVSSYFSLTPDNTAAISTLAIYGSGTANSGGGPFTSTVTGSLEVNPAGSYGIAPGAAGIWAAEGIPLTEAVEIELDGFATVIDAPSIGSRFTCPVHAFAELGPGEASLTGFEYDPSGCSGTGYLAECELESSKMQSGPWPLQAGSTSIRVEGFAMEVKLSGEGCPLSGTTSNTSGEVTLSNSVGYGALVTLVMSGELESSTAMGLLSGAMSGGLALTPSGVYGVI